MMEHRFMDRIFKLEETISDILIQCGREEVYFSS